MKKDLFVRVSLVVIALLLVLNLGGIVLSPTPTFAAKKYEYKVEYYERGGSQKILDQYSNAGWELIAATDQYLFFKK